MLWGFKIIVTEENIINSHSHDVHEFIICRSNTGTLVIDGTAYDFRKGLSFFLPSGVSHQTIGSEKDPADITVVHFDQQTLIKYTTPELQNAIKKLVSNSSYVSKLDEANAEHVKEKLRLSEILAKELPVIEVPLSQTMAGSILTQLLVHHCRGLKLDYSNKGDNRAKEMSKICNYIKTHPDSHISIDEMSKKANMSRTLFCSNFKKYTGMSLIEFTRNTRIDFAMQLLAKTEKTIAEISFKCGFNHMGHFSKTFKKRTNITPRQYRELTHSFGVPFPIINMIEY